MNTIYRSFGGLNVQYKDFQITVTNEESIVLIKENWFNKT